MSEESGLQRWECHYCETVMYGAGILRKDCYGCFKSIPVCDECLDEEIVGCPDSTTSSSSKGTNDV